MNDPLSPSVSWSLAQLVEAMPPPWTFHSRGRVCWWRAQPIGEPLGDVRRVVLLDRRGALRLDETSPERTAWRKPVCENQLIVLLNQWAALRTAQWELILSNLGLKDRERAHLLTALQRHEWKQARELGARIWAVSLNGKLAVPIPDQPADLNLLRWVLCARRDAEFLRRRRMARRHTRLLVMGRSLLRRRHPAWPHMLRRLDETALFERLGHLHLRANLLLRISRYPIDQAPRWAGPQQEQRFWLRLQRHLPGNLWPLDAAELEAAHALLLLFRPLFAFGTADDDPSFRSIRRQHGPWFVGQLVKYHGGSWAAMHQHWLGDAVFKALSAATVTRLSEVFSSVHGDDAKALEAATAPLREWTPGRWLATLHQWHAMTMPGAHGGCFQWQPLFPAPQVVLGVEVSSPSSAAELQAMSDALGSDTLMDGLVGVAAGHANFLSLRSADDKRLLAVVQVHDLRLASDSWRREHEIFWALDLLPAERQSARAALQACLAGAVPAEWSLLEWRQNWEAAAECDVLGPAIARSMMRAWESIKP